MHRDAHESSTPVIGFYMAAPLHAVSPCATVPGPPGAVGGLEVNVLGERNPRGIPSMVFIVRARPATLWP